MIFLDSPNTAKAAHLQYLHQQSCKEIFDRITDNPDLTYGDTVSRLSDLLLLLPSLRSFKKSIIVELFFSGLIGNVNIEQIIPYIMKLDVPQAFSSTPNGLLTSGFSCCTSNAASNFHKANAK